MKIRLASLFLAGLVAVLPVVAQPGPSLLENLGRGVVALRTAPGTTVVTWRVLGTDPEDVAFNLYRATGGAAATRLNAEPLTGPTHYTDTTADVAQANSYFVRPVVFGQEQEPSASFTVGAGAPVQDYLRVPLQVPAGGTTPAGSYTYAPGDSSAGDLDGDGEYELVVKWDPSNAQDNANAGYTGNVILDGYKLDGTRLWRLDLGINIRAGAHYTHFMVYDLDGDGIAEVACKTAPGSRDATGTFVATRASRFAGALPSFDPTTDHRNSGGYILTGHEFLTIFSGQTGEELMSTLYVPARNNDPTSPDVSAWGDNYGNRVDRFLAGVAYLDGQRPSLLMCRGYYTRAAIAAWDWRDGQLTQRWVFDTGHSGGPYSDYKGQGNHQLSVGDVDGDGKDEIMYGACAVDDNGTGLFTTGWGHGDALHMSDMDPDRPGLEVFQPHESPASYGPNGLEFRDAHTGALLWGVQAAGDIGRGVAFDVDPRYRGYEMWGSGSTGGMYTAQLSTPNALLGPRGVEIASGKPSMNFGLWWDGDLLRELLDNVTVSKWNWTTSTASALLAPSGVASNNGTKATPALSADLLGDWREEVVWRETGNNALRIYVTPHATEHRLYTLMHDRQYRQAIAWQNTGYNQPPHPGFFLGHDMAPVPRPNIVTSLSVLLGPPPPVFTGVSDDTGVSTTDRVTSDAALILRGIATPGTNVNIVRQGVGPIGTVSVNGAGEWALDYTGTILPEGTVSFTGTATDGSGNTGAPSAPFVVTIDLSAPAAPAIAFVAAAEEGGLLLSGTAAPGSTVTVTRVGAGPIGTAIADESGTWSFSDSSSLEPGVHNFTATATDVAGNVSLASAAYTIDSQVAPPVISGVAADTGISETDGITADAQLVISGTAPGGAEVTVTRAGVGSVGSVTAAADGTWSLDLSGTTLPDGTYTFVATATLGGQNSPASSPRQVTVDTTAPVVTAISRIDPTNASGSAEQVTFRVRFDEPVAGVDPTDFTLQLGDTLAGGIASLTAAGPGQYDVVVGPLTGEGSVRLDLNASGTGITDPAGNPVPGGFTAGDSFQRLLQGDGVWIRGTSGGQWSDHANWADGVVGSGVGRTADFSAIEVENEIEVHLDAPRTVGHLVFGDTDIASAGNWRVTAAGATDTLTFAVPSGSPTLTVAPLGVGAVARIAAPLTGVQGLTKLGVGVAMLSAPASLTGTLNVNGGQLVLEPGAALELGTSSVNLGTNTQLRLAGGTFTTGGLVTAVTSSLVIESGTATLNGGFRTNSDFGGTLRLNGGVLTATDVNIRRNSAGSPDFNSGFIVTGGIATVGTVGLGTQNSNGAMSVDGGDVTVTGILTIGNQVTGGRGGALRVLNGSLKVLESTTGMLLGRANNNVATATFTGGVAETPIITFGFNNTISQGTATVNLNGGTLYLGAGGLVKLSAAGHAAVVNLSAGTLGASADWTTALPLNLPAGGNVAVRPANANGDPFTVTLSGPVNGAGGFTKTGAGTLVLSGTSGFAGQATVSGGTLQVDGSVTNPAGALVIGAGGTLAGSGASAKPARLEAGGRIAPTGTLTLGGLTWDGGGSVALDLTAAERLVVTGTLAKGAEGALGFAFTATAPLAPGTFHTVATFGSTDLTAADLSYTGLPDDLGTFVVTADQIQFVTVPAGPAAAFQLWGVLEGLPAGLDGPADDADGDSLGNLLEFALGLDPQVIDAPDLTTTTLEVANTSYPAFAYVRRAEIGGATVEVQISPDLDFAQRLQPVIVSETVQADGTVVVVVRSSTPLTTEPNQFFRLSAALPSLNN